MTASPGYLKEIALRRDRVADFHRYPFDLPAIQALGRVVFERPVTFFVGENGSGKSTLLEAIAVALGFNAEGGSRHFNFTTRASHSELHAALRCVRGITRPRDGYFLRAESLFNVATEIERLDAVPAPAPPIADGYGARALHEQSHGETFLALIQNRFRGGGLYMLDEPEAALSPMRQMTLLPIIHDLVVAKSQLIIATHSPILLSYPSAEILQFGPAGIERVEYEETEHFRVTRDFLNRHRAQLKTLLGADGPV